VREAMDAAVECEQTNDNKKLIEYLTKYQADQHMTSFW
jgi:hypothetical protein